MVMCGFPSVTLTLTGDLLSVQAHALKVLLTLILLFYSQKKKHHTRNTFIVSKSPLMLNSVGDIQ